MEDIFLTINEASMNTGISAHTLRYWEKVFPGILAPFRTKGNQRRYYQEDIKIILRINKLLKEDLYSIAGARKVLEKKVKKIQIK